MFTVCNEKDAVTLRPRVFNIYPSHKGLFYESLTVFILYAFHAAVDVLIGGEVDVRR